MQRIASQNARVVILVQSTDSLNITTRERFVHLPEGITDHDVGVLLFTSDERGLHQLGDRVLVMADGGTREEWDIRTITTETTRGT